MPKVIVIIAGPTGAGKTRLTHRLAAEMGWVPLDNDEITESLASVALTALGQPADDRTSATYLEKVQPAKYDTLWQAAMRVAEAGHVAVIAAPFITQLSDPATVARIEAGCKKRGIRIAGIWLDRGEPMPASFPRWMHELDNSADRPSHNVVMEAREMLSPEIGWHVPAGKF